jgi:MarR family
MRIASSNGATPWARSSSSCDGGGCRPAPTVRPELRSVPGFGYTRTSKHAILFQKLQYGLCMASWSFLTNHARVLLCVAHDPGARLRDLATMVGVTEHGAHNIVSDLVAAGYVVRDKDRRGNEYRIERHLPLRDPISRERTVGEVLDLLVGVNAQRNGHGPDRLENG